MNRLNKGTLFTTMLAGAGVAALAIAQAPAPQAAAPPGAATQAAAPAVIDAPPRKDYAVPPRTRDYVKKAVELPSRQPHETIHDAYRKPAELLQFSNVRPGMRVVEFSSYGNYWSTMLSDILGDKGELLMIDAPFAAPMIPQGEAFVAARKNTKFQNIDYNKLELPRGIDLVWCYACFHEVLGTGTDMDPFLAKIFKAMKPGGRLLVVFYTSRDGMENRDVGTLHRIDPGTVRGTFQAAGFQMQEENRLLQNPQDDKRTKVFTEAEGDLADRTVYRFIKP